MVPAHEHEEVVDLLTRSNLTSILLDTGFNKKALEDVLFIQKKFDSLVGNDWDIIVPCYSENEFGLYDDAFLPSWALDYNGYNEIFARELLQQFGVDEEKCPCLVFLGFDQNDIFIYPLNALGGHWQRHFLKIANIAKNSLTNNSHLQTPDLKAQAMRDVRSYLRPRFRFEFVKYVGGPIASALGLASSTVSFLRP